jgi:ubiquinone/menaquinone biosynthesis C-methylase UbiE
MMAKFRFVEDNENLVDSLLANYPLDEAMAHAVGGNYEQFGLIEIDLLQHAGLRDGMSVLDMGCGSGRLAHALSKSNLRIDYIGVDVVQKLLNYAATKSHRHFRFERSCSLSIPVGTATLDLVCAFSLFTHLLHHETYLYMEDIYRILRPGGKLVFSFLEFAAEEHWSVFSDTVDQARTKSRVPLNTFIERSAIAVWASRLGFRIESYVEPTQPVGSAGHLGQTTAILQRD